MDFLKMSTRVATSFTQRIRSIALLAIAMLAMTSPMAHAQDVRLLSCIPSVIAGGSGASTTCTATLTAPAAAGGAVVTLNSSLPALAASALKVTVPAGSSTASFKVKTNAAYRRYSGLAFNATISAAITTTASANINVTAQARPAPIDSGVQIGQRFQWQGAICGGFSPVGQGDAGVLYTCSPATKNQNGTCTFKQECNLGCNRNTPNGTTFNDTCATTGSNTVSILQALVTGGDRVDATAIAPSPATAGNLTQVLPIIVDAQNGIGNVGGASGDANWFPHDQGAITFPTGASSVPFNLATSYVPEPVFIDVRAGVSSAGSVTVSQGRTGHQWLTLVPIEHPTAVPVPTLASLALTGNNPVTGGQQTFASFETSGISSGGSGPFFFTSSNPAVAQVPTSLTLPPSTVFGSQVFITTTNPPVDTPVTITATDGRYTYSTGLLVAHQQIPLLATITINPSHIVGGNPTTGSINLSVPAPAGGATATLTTDLTQAQVAASVTVPAGATSATFPITTSVVGQPAPVTITASLQGATQHATVVVTPPGVASVFSTFVISPSNLVSGGPIPVGFVQLAFPAPADAVIALTSSTPAVQVPATVTVPMNDSGVFFTVTNSNVTSAVSGTVTATYLGITDVMPVTVAPKPNTVTLNVTTSGKSGNSIASTPAGISVAVGNGQSTPFAPGTSLTLSVSGGRDAIWIGACNGQKAKTCTFTITADMTINVAVQ
jgi:hypothetical protein